VIRRVLDCGYGTEVVVVDDASSDGSREHLKQLENPKVHCFYHALNRGKHPALRLGFATANTSS
jgi:glycosyltransferase involved in cell wall biosynthesis